MSMMENGIDIENAFALVFGNINRFSGDYYQRLDPEKAKRAFRRKAKELHPDRASVTGMDEETLEASFKSLVDAYRIVSTLMADKALFSSFIDSVNRRNGTRRAPDTIRQSSGSYDPRARGERWTRTGSPELHPRKYRLRNRAKSFFFSGALPDRRLRTAQYLYYTGRIDWKTLIDALTWQAMARPRIGEIGIAYGYLDFAHTIDIIRHSRFGELFGSTASRIGALTPQEIARILVFQRSLGRPIGRFFIDSGIFTPERLNTYLEEMRIHNFGRAL